MLAQDGGSRKRETFLFEGKDHRAITLECHQSSSKLKEATRGDIKHNEGSIGFKCLVLRILVTPNALNSGRLLEERSKALWWQGTPKHLSQGH